MRREELTIITSLEITFFSGDALIANMQKKSIIVKMSLLRLICVRIENLTRKEESGNNKEVVEDHQNATMEWRE